MGGGGRAGGFGSLLEAASPQNESVERQTDRPDCLSVYYLDSPTCTGLWWSPSGVFGTLFRVLAQPGDT